MASREKRIELPSSAREPLPGAQQRGPADPNEQIQVTIVLRRASPITDEAIQKMGAVMPAERKLLTRESFAKLHGARAGDVAKIRVFASEYGLKVVSENREQRSIVLSGAVRNFSTAFGTKLHRYEHSTGTYRGRSGVLTIPARLAGVIEGVFGLDNRPQARAHFRIRKPATSVRAQASDASYSPLQVAQAYAFPLSLDGAGECIAILELGGGYRAQDLDEYFKNLGVATPKITAVSVDGGENSPSGDASGPDGEVSLDVELAGATAPGAQIAVYFAPNTDQGFIDALTTAIHDTKLRPTIVSISWGGPESSWTEQARNALNSACQDAAMMGVTVLVASGDNGATDGSSNGALTVDFPASSPYAIGCGGTRLTISKDAILSERAWNDLSQGEGATGGGVSEIFAIPAFQGQSGVPAAPNGFRGRGVPDVSADADPATGYNVFVDGQSIVIGGTSAVAPLWAGLLARINQAIGKPVGYLNVLIYSGKFASGFHDIVSGDNGGYSAAKGWDACTGLGTPNGAALLAALRGGSPA